MMAEYSLLCEACGEPFTASRRHARACSKRCQQRLYRGVPSAECQTPKSLHVLPMPRGAEVGSYALGRAPLAPPLIMPVNRQGRIAAGPFAGRTIGDMLRTASREGWLAYKLRPDGWYSAEWYPERRSIALCGPLANPPHSLPPASPLDPRPDLEVAA